MPKNKEPKKLGLEDIKTTPKNFFGKEIYPLFKKKIKKIRNIIIL